MWSFSFSTIFVFTSFLSFFVLVTYWIFLFFCYCLVNRNSQRWFDIISWNFKRYKKIKSIFLFFSNNLNNHLKGMIKLPTLNIATSSCTARFGTFFARYASFSERYGSLCEWYGSCCDKYVSFLARNVADCFRAVVSRISVFMYVDVFILFWLNWLTSDCAGNTPKFDFLFSYLL